MLVAALVLAALQGCAGGPARSEAAEATGAGLRAVRVTSVDDPGLELLDRERAALRDAGMTRVAMPFGVLLAADAGMPPAYVVEAAAILAEMMDQDLDGVADQPRTQAAPAAQSGWVREHLEDALTERQRDAFRAAISCNTTRAAARTCGMEPRDFRRSLSSISRRARQLLDQHPLLDDQEPPGSEPGLTP